jgi:hypothetical protein
MDDTTQQNAALVEQSAAATAALQNQAVQLNEIIKIFKLAKTTASTAMPTTQPIPINRAKLPIKTPLKPQHLHAAPENKKSLPAMLTKGKPKTTNTTPAVADNDNEWAEF